MPISRKPPLLLLAGMLSCASGPEPGPAAGPTHGHRPTPVDSLVASLPPAKLLPATDTQRKIDAAVDGFFQRAATRRGYIMTDKPLYQPGETVWFRAELLE